VILAKELLAAGAYRHREDGGLDGLIYAPFVGYLATAWSIDAEVAAPLSVNDLIQAVGAGTWVIASVSPQIRQRDAATPRQRGGHLVLVHGAGDDGVVFHNPSGDTPATQRSAGVTRDRFSSFFAGRGIIIR
jgi:hypothetical protein